jgi:hypothetical protein
LMSVEFQSARRDISEHFGVLLIFNFCLIDLNLVRSFSFKMWILSKSWLLVFECEFEFECLLFLRFAFEIEWFTIPAGYRLFLQFVRILDSKRYCLQDPSKNGIKWTSRNRSGRLFVRWLYLNWMFVGSSESFLHFQFKKGG